MGDIVSLKEELSIVKRTIHTTADFEYKDLVEISKDAIETAKEIFKRRLQFIQILIWLYQE